MAKNGKGRGEAANRAVADYIANLSGDHRALIVLKAQLYGGFWEPMLEDLRERLKAKRPFHNLAQRIQDDINCIEEMQKFEAVHEIDLSEYVRLEE